MSPVTDLVVVDEFLPEAAQLRAHLLERFSSEEMEGRTRFVWDYWHVPGQFTYLRTPARGYFPSSLHRRLVDGLRQWGRETLGCGQLSEPWLSVYVEGCRQERHVDPVQGPWAFVLSLTDWAGRQFRGGETVLQPGTGEGTEDVREVEPRFNRLTVFDAGVPHLVRTVHGCLDPAQARIALHGWFRWPRVVVESGPYRADDLSPPIRELTEWVNHSEVLAPLPGLVVFRLDLGAQGDVVDCRLLASTGRVHLVAGKVRDRVCRLAFPPGGGRIVLPLRVGDSRPTPARSV